MNARIVDSRKF